MATTTLNLNLNLTLIRRKGAQASADTAAILGHGILWPLLFLPPSLSISLLVSIYWGQILLNYPFGATSTL